MFEKNKKILVVVGLDDELKVLNNLPVISYADFGAKNSKNCLKILDKKNIDHVVSFGFCGSIDQTIKSGELVIPDEITTDDFKKRPISKELRKFYRKKLSDYSVHKNSLYSTKKVVFSAKEKSNIKKTFHASVIDMESKFIQEECLKLKIPFVAVRLVFDDLKFSLPQFVVKTLDENGKPKIKDIFFSIIEKPDRLIQLIRLGIIFYDNKKKLKKIAMTLFT